MNIFAPNLVISINSLQKALKYVTSLLEIEKERQKRRRRKKDTEEGKVI
jgi:hypothetical protein